MAGPGGGGVIPLPTYGGAMQLRSTASPCEVCGDRVRHRDDILVVSRKATGIKRMVCHKPKCQKHWKYNRTSVVRRWPVEEQERFMQTTSTTTKPARGRPQAIAPEAVQYIYDHVSTLNKSTLCKFGVINEIFRSVMQHGPLVGDVKDSTVRRWISRAVDSARSRGKLSAWVQSHTTPEPNGQPGLSLTAPVPVTMSIVPKPRPELTEDEAALRGVLSFETIMANLQTLRIAKRYEALNGVAQLVIDEVSSVLR